MQNYDHCSPTVTHCTFFENRSQYASSDTIFVNSYLDFFDSIVCGCSKCIYKNTSDIVNIDISHSDIQGGVPSGSNDLGGNIDLDPKFALDEDLHLMPDSPCIDVGTAVNVLTDMDGNIRPLDGHFPYCIHRT